MVGTCDGPREEVDVQAFVSHNACGWAGALGVLGELSCEKARVMCKWNNFRAKWNPLTREAKLAICGGTECRCLSG